MAERLEGGNIQIRSVGGVPMQQIGMRGVDMSVASREGAQQANTMAQLLDRMGASINQQAAVMRQEEALRFAAENPPTLEQIKLAKDGLPGAIPGVGKISGDFSYFGQALKKARTLQISSAFEQEGMNELTRMLEDVQNGVLKAEDVQQKIATISKGYTDALAKVDPEAAIKFNATIATHGNTVLKTAQEAEAKRIKAQNTIKVRDTFNNVKKLLEATVSQGEYTDPATGQKYSVDLLADTLRSNLQTQANAIGDAALSKEVLDGFDKELRDAKINAVTRFVVTNDALMADPIGTQRKIMTAQLDKMSGVMGGLLTNDMEAVAKINANVQTAMNMRETAERQRRADAKAADEVEFADVYTQFLTAPEGSKRQLELRGKITDIYRRGNGAIPDGVFKGLFEKQGGGDGNAMVEFNVLQGIYEGRITTPDQVWSYTKSGLSSKQAVAALKLLNREDKQDANELERGISKLAGIPVVPGSVVVLDPKGEEFKRRQQLKAEALEIEARFAREGKAPPTPRQILTEIETGLEKRRNSEAAKTARTQLQTVWEKRPWINGPITRGNLPALKQKATGDRTKEREVIQIERLLNQAEGVQ
jgi:hypothetical protein